MKTSYIISFNNCESNFKLFWEKFTEFAYEDGEIVFVDRGSTDASMQVVEEVYGQYRKRLGKFRDLSVIFVPHEAGLNEVAMLNKGIRASSGDSLILLEAQMEVIYDWYASMKSSIERESADIAGPYMNQTNNHQSSEKLLYDMNTDISRLRTFSHFYDYIHSSFLERAITVPYIESQCMWIKKSLFEDIGYFDDRFSVQQFADIDLCYRATKAGKKIIVCQDVLSMKTFFTPQLVDGDELVNTLTENAAKLSNKFIQEYGFSNDDEVQNTLKEMDKSS